MTYKYNNSYLRGIFLLFTPSLLSGVVISISVLIVTIVPLIGTILSRAHILQDELSAIQQATAGISATYTTGIAKINSVSYFTNVPLLIFWVITGFVLYLFFIEIIKLFSDAVHLEHEMHYVHSDPRQLVVELLARLVIRIVALGSLLLLGGYTTQQLIPSTVLAADLVAIYPSMVAIAHLLLYAILLLLSLILLTAFLRALFLRLRLFGA